jgi:hypothetical protein
LAAALVATMAAWSTGTPASAGTLLTTSTKLTAAIAEDGQQVTATVTVKNGLTDDGLGITPQGTVRFSDDQGDDLGTLTLPDCLLKVCTASYVIPIDRFANGIENGISQLRATYSGDLLGKPSTGVHPLSIQKCRGEDGCFGGVSAGGAEMTVNSDSDEGYILANFGGSGLPCGVNGGGPVGHVVGVDLNGNKEIYYMLSGAGAQAYHTMFVNGDFGEDDPDWFCYVSPESFAAYSQDGLSTDFPASNDSFNYLGPAPQIGSGPYNNYYVGLLAFCGQTYSLNDSSYTVGPPCLDSYGLYQSESASDWNLYVYLETPPGDPYLGGLKLPALPKLPSLS